MTTQQPRAENNGVVGVLGEAVWASLGVSVVAAVLDAGVASQGIASFFKVLPLSLVLYLPLGVTLGFVIGGMAAGMGLTWGGESGHWLGRPWRDSDFDQQLAAGLLSLAVSLLFELILVDGFARGPAASMANHRLAALATGVAASAMVALLGLCAPAMWQCCRRLVRTIPRSSRWPISATVMVGLVALAFAVALWALAKTDWRAIPFAAPTMLLVLFVGISLGLGFQRRRYCAGSPSRRWRMASGVAIMALAVGMAPWVAKPGQALDLVQADGMLLPRLIQVGRTWTDRDRDGYSSAFGGGDCDDTRADVHPGAHDTPGNGRDENCSGTDAPLHAAVAHGSAPLSVAARQFDFKGNLLLICIDTLRGDVLDSARQGGPHVPRLQQLAKASVYFSAARSQGANTPQSFPSIFTSRYPSRVPFVERFTGYPVVKAEALSIFELLQQHGIHTVGVSSHFYFTQERGIRQGFDQWDNTDATSLKDSNKDIASPRIVPRAIRLLQQLAAKRERFAMFVHLFEPHSTYVKHPEYTYVEHGSAGLREKYQREVQFVDGWVGKLIDAVDAMGLGQQTAIVLFSDHGEAFAEHRFYFHGQALYDEVLHVPMLWRVPGVQARTSNVRVGLIDVGPTLLELAGIATPAQFQGLSLVPAILGKPDEKLAQRKLGAVLMPYPAWPQGQQAMYLGTYKVVRRLEQNRFEIYDLARDPGEQHNLGQNAEPWVRQLQAEQAAFAESELE